METSTGDNGGRRCRMIATDCSTSVSGGECRGELRPAFERVRALPGSTSIAELSGRLHDCLLNVDADISTGFESTNLAIATSQVLKHAKSVGMLQ
jgi:hypothetical protein